MRIEGIGEVTPRVTELGMKEEHSFMAVYCNLQRGYSRTLDPNRYLEGVSSFKSRQREKDLRRTVEALSPGPLFCRSTFADHKRDGFIGSARKFDRGLVELSYLPNLSTLRMHGDQN